MLIILLMNCVWRRTSLLASGILVLGLTACADKDTGGGNRLDDGPQPRPSLEERDRIPLPPGSSASGQSTDPQSEAAPESTKTETTDKAAKGSTSRNRGGRNGKGMAVHTDMELDAIVKPTKLIASKAIACLNEESCPSGLGLLAFEQSAVETRYCGAILLDAETIVTGRSCVSKDIDLSPFEQWQNRKLLSRFQVQFPKNGREEREILAVEEILDVSKLAVSDENFLNQSDYLILRLQDKSLRKPFDWTDKMSTDAQKVFTFQIEAQASQWVMTKKTCSVVQRSWLFPGAARGDQALLALSDCASRPETRVLVGMPILDESGRLLAMAKQEVGFKEERLENISIFKFFKTGIRLEGKTVRDFNVLVANNLTCLPVLDNAPPRSCAEALPALPQKDISMETLLRDEPRARRQMRMDEAVAAWNKKSGDPFVFKGDLNGEFNASDWTRTYQPQIMCARDTPAHLSQYKKIVGARRAFNPHKYAEAATIALPIWKVDYRLNERLQVVLEFPSEHTLSDWHLFYAPVLFGDSTTPERKLDKLVVYPAQVNDPKKIDFTDTKAIMNVPACAK